MISNLQKAIIEKSSITFKYIKTSKNGDVSEKVYSELTVNSISNDHFICEIDGFDVIFYTSNVKDLTIKSAFNLQKIEEFFNPIIKQDLLVFIPKFLFKVFKIGEDQLHILKGEDFTIPDMINFKDLFENDSIWTFQNNDWKEYLLKEMTILEEKNQFYDSKDSKYTLENTQIREHKEFYPNGQIQVQQYYKDGKLDGEYKFWWNNGQLGVQSFLKNGKLEGEYKKWHNNGQIKQQTYYKEGKKEGEYKSWYENGKIELQTYYKNDKFDGEWEYWNKDGTLKEKLFYKDGKITESNNTKNIYIHLVEPDCPNEKKYNAIKDMFVEFEAYKNEIKPFVSTKFYNEWVKSVNYIRNNKYTKDGFLSYKLACDSVKNSLWSNMLNVSTYLKKKEYLSIIYKFDNLAFKIIQKGGVKEEIEAYEKYLVDLQKQINNDNYELMFESDILKKYRNINIIEESNLDYKKYNTIKDMYKDFIIFSSYARDFIKDKHYKDWFNCLSQIKNNEYNKQNLDLFMSLYYSIRDDIMESYKRVYIKMLELDQVYQSIIDTKNKLLAIMKQLCILTMTLTKNYSSLENYNIAKKALVKAEEHMTDNSKLLYKEMFETKSNLSEKPEKSVDEKKELVNEAWDIELTINEKEKIHTVMYGGKKREIEIINEYSAHGKDYTLVKEISDGNKTKTFFTKNITYIN